MKTPKYRHLKTRLKQLVSEWAVKYHYKVCQIFDQRICEEKYDLDQIPGCYVGLDLHGALHVIQFHEKGVPATLINGKITKHKYGEGNATAFTFCNGLKGRKKRTFVVFGINDFTPSPQLPGWTGITGYNIMEMVVLEHYKYPFYESTVIYENRKLLKRSKKH